MALEFTGRPSVSGVPTERTDQGGYPPQSKRLASTPQVSDPHIVLYAAFFILEAAFTAFAWYCYARPRQLPESLGFQEATIKSGVIAIFSIWHTIAVTCAFNICAEAFSREWAAKPGQETDAVSTVTSGFITRTSYFFRPRATKTYQVAFLVFLGLLLMRTTGPSAITVSSGVEFSQKLPIGLISTASITQNLTDLESENFFSRLVQAQNVVRLEQLVGVPWGYVSQPNWVIPLPNKDAMQSVNKVTYNTDLIFFNHTCHWQAPSVSPGHDVRAVTFENESWSWSFLGPPGREILVTDDSRTVNGSNVIQLLPGPGGVTGKSVFLFLGGNSSFPVNSTDSAQAWIDLSHLPSYYNPGGFVTYDAASLMFDWLRAPLASLLICNPHLIFTTGTVIVNPVANITALDVRLVPDSISRTPSPGNIDPEAARTLFTSILAVAAGLPDPRIVLHDIDYVNFNSVAAEMFLQVPPARNWDTASAIRPLDPETIDKHLNVFTLSALKAFTSGYDANSDIIYFGGGVYETPVDGFSTKLTLALATSTQFAILHAVLFGLLGIVLAVVLFLNITQPRVPFTLEHVKQT